MDEIKINLQGGKSKRLLTKGKLCDKNIVVTAEGGADRYDEGVADGKQAAYDTFWDAFQLNRQYYTYAFAYDGWTDDTYNPKYPIETSLTDAMVCVFFLSQITDTKVPITIRGTANQCFGYASKLKRIPKLIFDNPTNVTNMFRGCSSLEEIYCEGEINISIDFSQCPLLSAASVQSIIDCLKDLTGATQQTLTLHADVVGRMTQEQKDAITAKNWILA